jgi:hypothetical protein
MMRFVISIVVALMILGLAALGIVSVQKMSTARSQATASDSPATPVPQAAPTAARRHPVNPVSQVAETGAAGGHGGRYSASVGPSFATGTAKLHHLFWSPRNGTWSRWFRG